MKLTHRCEAAFLLPCLKMLPYSLCRSRTVAGRHGGDTPAELKHSACRARSPLSDRRLQFSAEPPSPTLPATPPCDAARFGRGLSHLPLPLPMLLAMPLSVATLPRGSPRG